MDESRLGGMRPCVRQAFDQGARDKEHLRKMTFAIIYEMNRLCFSRSEIKQALISWNRRCYRVLSPGDAQRQLADFVDWFFKRECKLSCKSLGLYCLFPNGSGCRFQRKPKLKGLPFSLPEVRLLLERRFAPHGNAMWQVLDVMAREWREKGTPACLFMGYRRMQAALVDQYRTQLDLMTISRTVYRLADAGVIRVTQGRRGTFGTRKANEYEFLPWPNDSGDYA